ncbi:[protein-PII] uridylyltransferase [Motiliproteus sp. MSK22-1]|uniref:[protein-PII] uridylyltransferase n=1 Tax=Motiliproteus sp. MSK22-1 TaxID=1897630 RepID=UPI0009770841|nr:[protein-PII] uridylyltransferase [Motiliproteus sp. MSK22-1]OMH39157.1 [protein-PII] uridylyltransferase [Motiliproteus sp. MSK22-1]
MTDILSHFKADNGLFDPTSFEKELENSSSFLAVFKKALKEGQEELDRRFREGVDIRTLIYGRAWMLDQLLRRAWQQYDWPEGDRLSLIAVGGYGRGELHPHSDIDLLILLKDEDPENFRDSIEGFITFLWDITLDVGSSVRTISQCVEEASKDITIATNLIESRTLVGDDNLRNAMYAQVTEDDVWSSKEFYKAKVEEQRQRHHRTNDTEYNLEPNIKDSAGGLRDIQTVGWVAKRHFGATYVHDLVDHGFLTDSELIALDKGELYLWSIRYALHMLTNRCENRLLFDHQRTLAEFFGYQDTDGALAVEQFMSKYYRIAMSLAEFNDMLLQHFEEAILDNDTSEEVRPLNNRFQVRANHIEITSDDVFEKSPFAMMEMFVLLAQNPGLEGVRSSTMRLLRIHRHLIDDSFREDIRNTSLFMELLRSPEGITTELKRMNRYGILGRYLPEFGRIVGQMQHDLFHIYTVDAHTLKVITNMRRFRHGDQQEKFPIANRVVRKIPKMALLYIAGLYHDIAKGRGGDHSALGGEDARDFCRRHHLGKWDTLLVGWLVENHLLMSMTAQRKDITDPEVIHEFALKIRDITHLDYLYALTVADICATNNTLWNNWRASLMRQLYNQTQQVLRRGLENPKNREDKIEQVQKEALNMLKHNGISDYSAECLWATLGDDYFLREEADDIAWHTEAILNHSDREQPLVLVKGTSAQLHEGATQIFIFMRDHEGLFAASVAALDQLNLSIQDARIITNDDGFSYNTYIVLDENNQPIGDNPDYIMKIKNTLVDELDDPADYKDIVQRRMPRQLKLFAMQTDVVLSTDPERNVTTMEVTTSDRPGLLARIGQVLLECQIHLTKATIVNVGERVEDVFFICDHNGQPITDPALAERLQRRIIEELDRQMESALG